MNNIFVYCEITEEGLIADVSLELISKARKLANDLSCQLEAIVIGSNIENLEATLYLYGVDIINYANDERLFAYQTLPHFSIVIK
jgi:electron transfer flavoprotein alpha subunit